MKFKNMRRIVEKGYNNGDYEKHFRLTPKLNNREARFLKKLMEMIPPKGKILDLGSGVGIPVDMYLVDQGFQLTGIDISIKHIQKAQKSVPGANFLHQDFTKINFQPNSFDAIISFYALFHIPRTEHDSLFKKIYSLLNDKGVVILTLGCNNIELDIDEFIGASKMAWSSFSAKKNKELLHENGFKIVYEEEEDEENEHHLWILAQKIL